jgi:clan AA aspartic protease
MGLTYADIELISGDDLALVRRGLMPEDQVRKIKVSALVDSGATLMSIPPSVQAHLGLSVLGEGDAELADGRIVSFDLAGPIEVRFANRRAVVEALVSPQETEVLLGVIPLEAMDLLLDPKQQQLIVNPKSPDRARLMLK